VQHREEKDRKGGKEERKVAIMALLANRMVKQRGLLKLKDESRFRIKVTGG
jgi:hypothetical protein